MTVMEVVWSAVFLSILPNVGGWLGSFITLKNIPTWYEGLNKPAWRPANWVFGPMWTYLYTTMGFASYLIWRDSDYDLQQPALVLYASQLAINWIWTPIFFGAHNLKLAFFVILALDLNIAACIYTFLPVNSTAAYLMVPYLLWVCLASALNYRIWLDNPAKKSD